MRLLRNLLLFIAVIAATAIVPAHPEPVTSASVEVIDGDTIRFRGEPVRLVGFDAPELGQRGRRGLERMLAARATSRLRQLIARGGADLELVACNCRPGTQGTMACNYGRACGTLRVAGRDVGFTLIEEGLAHRYVCEGSRCPPREGWCPRVPE